MQEQMQILYMDCYLAVKKKSEIMKFSGKWMELKKNHTE